MSIRIIKAGVLDTLQDLGRFGFQQLGINPGGVMDHWSAKAANFLVGNAPTAAVIEIHFPAAEFFFEEEALIAVCGADFSVHVNAEEIPLGHPVLLNRFSILQFYTNRKGARAYIAVHGGMAIPLWLKSYSTNLKAASGGFKGRALQKEDEISITPLPASVIASLEHKEFLVLPWDAGSHIPSPPNNTYRILKGNEWKQMTKGSQQNITELALTVTAQSDRMGYRLQGEPLLLEQPMELISSAVSFGTIQLLPDGQLTMLMADHQTTGGYPRIAHVISADLPRLAQVRAGEKINFQLTDQHTAETALLQQQQHLLQLQNACTFRIEKFLYAGTT